MINPIKACCQMLGSEPPISAPFDTIIALGYSDGPTDGILRCGECRREFHFEMLDSRLDASGDDDIRIFSLSPIPEGSLAAFTAAMSHHQQPSHPFWLPTWTFPSDRDRDRTNALVDRILDQEGPVEWVIASSSWLSGDISAARRVSAGEWRRDQDWFAILGLVGTARRE